MASVMNTSRQSSFALLMVLWSLFLLSHPSLAYNNFSLNPVNNFCSRWLSGSIVKNDILYIDGGIQKYNGTDQTTPITGIQNYFIQIPLKETWDWKTNIVINETPKNVTNPRTGTQVPSLIRHTMFQGPSNQTDVYIFGGTTYMGNQSFPGYIRPDSSTYALWSYTPGGGGNTWNQYDISQPFLANHGAAAEAVDQGLAFYLNGQIDWGTSTKTQDYKNTSLYTPLDGILIINMVDQTSVNVTTPGISGGGPRIGSKMEYIASVGGKGILVALGGQVNQQRPIANASEGIILDFNSVDVFDIDSYLSKPSSNGTWYTQNTTGDIPEPRIDFCLISAAAPDNSSYHIYLYGGINPVTNTLFDDVYILSLPSFTWTSVFLNGGTPRWGHNCHRAGARQMVTVGGNITTQKCDWEQKGVAFLEMSTITWGSVFLTNTSEYEVPSKVFSATGGKATGGATIKKPSLGWTNAKLGEVWNTTRRYGNEGGNSTASTLPNSRKSSKAGAIAGGIVGGIVGLALIAGALLFLYRRRQKAEGPHELENAEVAKPPGELPDEKRKHELEAVNYDPGELPGQEAKELDAPREFVEAPRETTTHAAELPGTNVAPGGRHGVPIVRTPGDELLSPPSPEGINSPHPAP